MLKSLWLQLKGRGPKPVAPPASWTIETLASRLRPMFVADAEISIYHNEILIMQQGGPIAALDLIHGVAGLSFERSLPPHHAAAIALDINDVLPVEVVGFFTATKLNTEGASVN